MVGFGPICDGQTGSFPYPGVGYIQTSWCVVCLIFNLTPVSKCSGDGGAPPLLSIVWILFLGYLSIVQSLRNATYRTGVLL